MLLVTYRGDILAYCLLFLETWCGVVIRLHILCLTTRLPMQRLLDMRHIDTAPDLSDVCWSLGPFVQLELLVNVRLVT
jgi:hypothetical protein